MNRRSAIAGLAAFAALGAHAAQKGPAPTVTPPGAPGAKADPRTSVPTGPWFQISLAEWSYHQALQAGKMDHLDFPKVAKEDHAIDAVEYVSTFFKQKGDAAYARELRKRCLDHGVKSVLIMCDGEGNLGDPDDTKRAQAVENHRKWLETAALLGCHCIRVNAYSGGTPEEQQKLCADGLHRLCEIADPLKLGVIIENHGGLSSDGQWLSGVITKANHKRAGTLPDFGNFTLSEGKSYDRYQGVKELMPFAQGVSAKSYDFNDAGDETTIDFARMLEIVRAAGYHGRIGIEYEGARLSEPDGVKATKKLLERLRDKLA